MPAHILRTTGLKGKSLQLALLFACVFAANATEFHVAPKGKDSNRGSRFAPFASLGRARAENRVNIEVDHGPSPGAASWVTWGLLRQYGYLG